MTKASASHILRIAAAANSGSGGACLFALDTRGRLSFTAQASPGGPWRGWQGPKFSGQPAPAAAIAAADQNNGCLMLVLLTPGGDLWSIAQNGPSDVWLAWQGPKIGGQHIAFKAIAAGGQVGTRGLQLMAADVMGYVWSCHQTKPGADWSGWSKLDCIGPAPRFVSELAMSGQNNGCLMLFSEARGQITALPQSSPDGAWGYWTSIGQNQVATELASICACQQGGWRGVQFWGLDGAGQIWTVFQDSAGGPWDPWQGPGFIAQPEPFVDLAAADQNNGCTIPFAVNAAGDLWAISQNGPAGNWSPWRQMGAPLG